MGRIGNYSNYMNSPAIKVCYDIYTSTLQLHESFYTALQCTLSDTILLARERKRKFTQDLELLS
jgi:hypothetical protein